MNVTLWIPAMIALGLLALGLMYAFIFGCEKV
jgi:hypothetical protein